jgi:hypothetical protein
MAAQIEWGDVGFGIYGTHPKAVFLIKEEGGVFALKKRIRVTDKPRWTEKVEDAGIYDSEQLAKQAAQDIAENI